MPAANRDAIGRVPGVFKSIAAAMARHKGVADVQVHACDANGISLDTSKHLADGQSEHSSYECATDGVPNGITERKPNKGSNRYFH